MDTQTSSSPDMGRATRVNVYEVRPKAEGAGFVLVSSALASGRMEFTKEHVAVGYAMLHSGSYASVIRVYDGGGKLTASHEQPAAKSQT